MGHVYQEKQKAKYHSRYIDWLCQSDCAPDLLINKLFPNGKEVTESCAMFEATTKLPDGYEWNNPNVTVYVVGDGVKPRTAALFAYRTKWQCVSIDPELRPALYNIDRLSLVRKRVEEVSFTAETTLIVLPHSHAKIENCLTSLIGSKRAVIAMQCCVPLKCNTEPDIVYRDDYVWSPHNEIKIWTNI